MKSLIIVFCFSIFSTQSFAAAQADKKATVEDSTQKFSAQTQYPFLLHVLGEIVSNTAALEKEIREHNQYQSSYDTMANRLNRLKLCHVMRAHADAIFALPDLQKELPSIAAYIKLQTPEEPTTQQKPLMPLKYFNVFGHALDSLRPQLEQHPECAAVFNDISYDLRKGNPFKYRSYDPQKHSKPPTKLSDAIKDPEFYDTQYDVSPYLIKRAASAPAAVQNSKPEDAVPKDAAKKTHDEEQSAVVDDPSAQLKAPVAVAAAQPLVLREEMAVHVPEDQLAQGASPASAKAFQAAASTLVISPHSRRNASSPSHELHKQTVAPEATQAQAQPAAKDLHLSASPKGQTPAQQAAHATSALPAPGLHIAIHAAASGAAASPHSRRQALSPAHKRHHKALAELQRKKETESAQAPTGSAVAKMQSPTASAAGKKTAQHAAARAATGSANKRTPQSHQVGASALRPSKAQSFEAFEMVESSESSPRSAQKKPSSQDDDDDECVML